MKAQFLNTKIGDKICLNHYPFKPMEVTDKNMTDKLITIGCRLPVSTFRTFTAKEFNKLKYVFFNSL